MLFTFKTLAVSVSVALLVSADTSTTDASSSKKPACVNPEIRREWRTFSDTEKQNWADAVKCLSKLPHTNLLTPTVDPSISLIPAVNKSGSYYDDFVYMHMDLNTRIHTTGLFLPFHRWYVYVYGEALKSKCGYKGVQPYWNWTMDTSDFFNSALFKESSLTSGIGGWGNASNDFEIYDGAFHDFHLSYPSPHTLRRNFTLQPWIGFAGKFPGLTNEFIYANSTFTSAEVTKLVTGYRGDFKGFQTEFEKPEGAHGNVHLIIGGDMGGQCPANAPANCTPGPTWSANEPLFWLHHAMVDKVWSDWQHEHPENYWAFHGGATQNSTNWPEWSNGAAPWLSLDSVMPNDGLFPAAKIGDVFNTTAGLLCYKYV